MNYAMEGLAEKEKSSVSCLMCFSFWPLSFCDFQAACGFGRQILEGCFLSHPHPYFSSLSLYQGATRNGTLSSVRQGFAMLRTRYACP